VITLPLSVSRCIQHLHRERLRYSLDPDSSENARVLHKLVRRTYCKPSNTKDFLEDIFNSIKAEVARIRSRRKHMSSWLKYTHQLLAHRFRSHKHIETIKLDPDDFNHDMCFFEDQVLKELAVNNLEARACLGSKSEQTIAHQAS